MLMSMLMSHREDRKDREAFMNFAKSIAKAYQNVLDKKYTETVNLNELEQDEAEALRFGIKNGHINFKGDASSHSGDYYIGLSLSEAGIASLKEQLKEIQDDQRSSVVPTMMFLGKHVWTIVAAAIGGVLAAWISYSWFFSSSPQVCISSSNELKESLGQAK